MPGFNGTGPRGIGPMTGGSRGSCNAERGFRHSFSGYAFMPRGRGYGRCNAWPVSPGSMPDASSVKPEQDLESLQQQAQDMKTQLAELEAMIQQMGEKA